MTKKKFFIISLMIAFFIGFPFKWLQYKGELEGVSIFKLIDLGMNNIFFDFSILTLNTLIIFGFWSLVQSKIVRK